MKVHLHRVKEFNLIAVVLIAIRWHSSPLLRSASDSFILFFNVPCAVFLIGS
jgi:hypothetical protein